MKGMLSFCCWVLLGEFHCVLIGWLFSSRCLIVMAGLLWVCTCAEVRQEAVQQALAAMQNRPKPSLPMPSKRTSVMAKSPDRERHDSGGYFQ